jgi:signal transduction histidine kinase
VSRPHRRSRAALRRELRTRDAFLARVSQGLSARVSALAEAPGKEMIEALQGFARELAIIAGDREARMARRATLDVGLHVEQIIDGWRREHGARAASGPTLQVERTGALVAAVDGDHIASILGELVSNAHKYGRGRPIRVLVEADAELVRIVVEDEGAGFVASPGLGQRFVRGPGTERVRGFGVGLWLIQALASAHGGALSFAPRSGGGTRAIVTLRRQAP